MTREAVGSTSVTCYTQINIALMDPRLAQPFHPATMPAAMPGGLAGGLPDLRQHQQQQQQKRLTQITEETIPRNDNPYYQPNLYPPPPLPPPPEPALPLSQDVSDAEPRAEDSAAHPSKRQRMTHTCEVCGTTYTEKRALARHRHTDQHRQRLGLPPLKKHECSVCGTQFSRRHDRMRHENERHGGAKSSTSPADSAKASSRGRPTPPPQPPMDVDRPCPRQGGTPTSDGEDGSITPGEPMMMEDGHFPSELPLNRPYYGSSTPVSVSSQLCHPSGPHIYATPDSMDSGSLGPIYEQQLYDLTHMRSPGTTLDNIALDNMTDETASDDGEASSHHDSAIDVDGSRKPSDVSQAGSDYSAFADSPILSRTRSFELPSISLGRRSLMSRRGKIVSAGSTASKWPMLCFICGSPFEDQQETLLSHLRKHMEDLTSVNFCTECQVGFTRQEDLARHRTSAAHGNCGFAFPHARPCTGHHPPLDDDPWAVLTDRDSFQLSVKLRHWEQSQLQAYICQIKDLVAVQNGKGCDPRRGSVASFQAHPPSRPASLYSTGAISVRTHQTAPVDRGSNGESDVGGLAQRLRKMTFARSKNTHETWERGQFAREPARKPSSANSTLSKSLRKAIYRCALDRVEKLLAMGADTGVLQGDDAMLTIMALWDRASAQALIVQHTIGQQCYGARCGCALSRPTESRDPELIKALLDHGANANDPGGLCGFPLHTAAYMGKPEVVRILIDYGAAVHARAGKYGSALCCAAARADLPGNVETVRLLVEHGADGHAAAGPEGSAIALARRRREVCSTGIIGKEAVNPEATARLNCCDQILEILGAGD